MKKLKFLLLIISSIFLFSTPVDAEVPTGEQYSEFDTNKTKLMEVITAYTSFDLWAYTPRINEFLNGSLSLVRYYDNTDDRYSNWAIRIYRSSRSPGNYTMNWITVWETNSIANEFCVRAESPVPLGGTTNSTVCSVVGNTAYLSLNYKLDVADTGTAYIDFQIFEHGMSANYFLRLCDAVYYPQIVPSTYTDTDTLTQQQQVIINQNQQIINNQNQTNNKLDSLNQNITNDNVSGVENAFESFEGFIAENSTITQLITMPITLYSSILNGLQTTCQPFVLGNLLGTNLTLPCINIGNYLGSSLWTMIDIIISGFAIFAISKKFIKIFNNFSSMKEGDVIND